MTVEIFSSIPIYPKENQMKLTSNFIRLSMLVLGLFLLGTATVGNAQSKIHISGYGNVHYMDHDGMPVFVGKKNMNNGFFQIREFSLFFDIAITDKIIASTELEASNNGNAYTANYAYVDIQATDNLTFRAGKILVPFLSYNENKPNFKQNLMSQPFTAWNIAPVNPLALGFHGFGWSDAGAMVNWHTVLGEAGLFDLKFSLINGLGSDSNVLDDNTVQLDAGLMTPVVRTRDGLVQNEEVNELMDNNNNKATVLKASFKPMSLPIDFGVSWYRGAWDPAGKKNLQMVGGHLNWLTRNWSLKGEYVIASVEQDAGIDPVADAGMVGPATLNTSTGDYNMNAYYLEASVVPIRWPNDRFLRLVTRYDAVDTNDKAMFTPFDRSRITLGLEWQLGKNTRLRYEWQRAKLHDFDKAPMPYKMAGGKEVIQMHMPSLIFSF